MIHISVYKSKLKTTYPTSDPSKWLVGDWQMLDPVFAGRLAYYCQCSGKKLKFTGYRTTARQKVLYNEYLDYKRTGILGPDRVKLAAAPGKSAHEYHLAIDADNDHPIYQAVNSALRSYGLCKPLWGRGEHWHIQPIEANTDSSTVFKSLAPVDLAPLLKAKFSLEDATVDYLASYEHAEPLFEGLLAGKKTFSPETVTYISKYEYGIALLSKLGIRR